MADREQSPTHDRPEPHDPAPVGSRPATGARVVDSASGFGAGFGAGQEATDFLGLSQELAGIDPGIAPGSAVQTPTPLATDDPSAGWLMRTDEDGVEEFAQGDEQHDAHERRERSSGGSFSGAFFKVAAALLLGGGATFGYLIWSRAQPVEPPPATASQTTPTRRPVEPASEPEPAPRTAFAPEASSTPVDGGSAETEPASGEPEAAATPDPDVATELDPAPAHRAGEQRLAEWIRSHGWSESADPGAPVSGSLLTALLGLGTNPATRSHPAAGSSAPVVPNGTTAVALVPTVVVHRSANPGIHAEPTPASSPIGVLRTATAEDLAGIWMGDTVPMEALDSETRILTPAVGDVRVVLKTGEIFDGRLYALGAGQVWLETGIGRLALARVRVQSIDAVNLEEVNGKLVVDLPRMRVRTRGGLFFGKVVARDDRRVTILTEDGARLTLESMDIEAAPLGDTRVIGPVEPRP